MTYHITQKDIKVLWKQLQKSAERRGIAFELTPLDMDEIGIPLTCPVLGIPLEFHRDAAQENSISFDRIDSSLGYTRENVIVVSLRANRLKSNASLDEMRSLVEFYESLASN